MSKGYWGSRLPLANIICSKMVFIMLGFGLRRRRVINRFKRIFSSPKVTLINTSSPRQAFMEWMDQGFNKINIGGGPKDLAGFVNIDFVKYPNVQRQIVANILDLSFIPDRCIFQVHSNHVIEHLASGDLINQFREWHRILKMDGLLTIRCPNALGAAYGFWFEPVIENQKEEFIKLGWMTTPWLITKATGK